MDAKTWIELRRMSKRDWRTISIITLSVGIIPLSCAWITFTYFEWEPCMVALSGHRKCPFQQYTPSPLIIGIPLTALRLGGMYTYIMERRKKLLLIVTIILLAITLIWGITVYQHIQAHQRMTRVYYESFESLNDGLWVTPGLPESLFEWGNGPILTVSGCILAFAWIFLIFGWLKVSSSKTNP